MIFALVWLCMLVVGLVLCVLIRKYVCTFLNINSYFYSLSLDCALVEAFDEGGEQSGFSISDHDWSAG